MASAPNPHLISESYFSLFFCGTAPSGRFIVGLIPTFGAQTGTWAFEAFSTVPKDAGSSRRETGGQWKCWWSTPLDTRKACQRNERRGRNLTSILLEDPVRGIRRLTISTTRNRLQGPTKPNHPLGVNWRSWPLKGKNWSENRDSFDLGYLVLGYVTRDNYHGRCQSYLLGICTWSSPIKTNYMGGFFCSSFHKWLFPVTQTFEPEPSCKTRRRLTTFKC